MIPEDITKREFAAVVKGAEKENSGPRGEAMTEMVAIVLQLIDEIDVDPESLSDEEVDEILGDISSVDIQFTHR